MNHDPGKYKTWMAPQFAADPFFQEWVFHPLGESQSFWLDLLIGHSQASMQMQIARARLLQYSTECRFIGGAIEEYIRMKTDLNKETNSEVCFFITMDYWSRLKERLHTFEFEKNLHEIQFFKVIKPLFTGERDYYSFLHHAELFGPSEDQSKFWQRQYLRLEKFKNENEIFYKSYTTGETKYDEWWYCRAEFRDSTAHDGEVANYLGMVRYLQYVNEQLQKI